MLIHICIIDKIKTKKQVYTISMLFFKNIKNT